MLNNFLFLIFSYLVSSIPFGLIIGFIFYKKDIRKEGSKNIGATNVYRICSKKAGIATFILDGLKGAIPVLIAKQYFSPDNFYFLVALVCIIGHVFPIYLKFKGGKAVSTTIFILFVANPKIGAIAVSIWLISLLLFGYSSLSSILMALLLVPISTFCAIEYPTINYSMIIFSIIVCAIISIKHRANINRLINKEEKKVFSKSIF
jgi:glycerol-3-phosphate acyltransferase PlsY